MVARSPRSTMLSAASALLLAALLATAAAQEFLDEPAPSAVAPVGPAVNRRTAAYNPGGVTPYDPRAAMYGAQYAQQQQLAARQQAAAGYTPAQQAALAARQQQAALALAARQQQAAAAAGGAGAAAGGAAAGDAAAAAAAAAAPAAAGAAVAAPAPAAPRLPRVAPGECAVNFAATQQCGGNLTGTLYNCSMFDSCDNSAWAGGCCPAAAPCATLPTSGSWCMTCGGKTPRALVAASTAAAAAPNMCTTMGPHNDYDHACVLGASLKFYEAQRAGKLPAGFPIKWRGDAGLNDRAPNGASIAGGWYDAGDMTRFTFPIAYTVSTLALALTEFPDAFSAEGRAESLLSSLKWAADWLVAARYAPDSLVAVTWAPGGSIKDSHNWWGRPEEVAAPAAVRAVRGNQAGADLLAMTAAALASVSVVFRGRDLGYSDELLDVARGLFQQATESKGFYSDTVPEVKGFYQSYSYLDDLAWGAAWLAMRTKDPEDVANAQFFFQQHIDMEGGGDKRRYDYNNVLQGTAYLLAKLDPGRKDVWSRPIRESMAIWLRGQQNITYSPKGMAWMDNWGNFRYVANQAFMGLLHNQLYPDLKRRVAVYTCFARKQARIMLGETGRSFVVGVGTNPPCRPHHRGASCAAGGGRGALPCDCTALYNEGCNANTLFGALVGGPNKEDKFEDVRTDFAATEVTLDWNAGLTGMLAGLTGSKVTWDDCKAQGLGEGRGDVPATLTSGAPAAARPAPAWQQLLLAFGVVAMAHAAAAGAAAAPLGWF